MERVMPMANVVEFPTGRIIDLDDDEAISDALDGDVLPKHVGDAVRSADASHVLDGRYEVGDVIGRGATSIVCRGRDRLFQCDVAIKLLNPPDDKLGELVMRGTIGEARTLRRLNSPHVVRVHDAGIDGIPYIVMDLEVGNDGTCAAAAHSDERYWARHLDEAMGWGHDLALGLSTAHALNIFHFDVKLLNILIESVNRRAKLIDFGVGASSHGLGGTPAYMAPEHARALRDDIAIETLDRAKLDVFGLGASLYHLIYGKTITTPVGTRSEQLTTAADARPTVSPETPTRWGYGAGRAAKIIRRAIAHDPADRYASAADLAADIDAWLQSKPLLEEKARYRTRFKLWCYRARAPLAAVAVSIAGLITLAIISTILWSDVKVASAKLDTLTKQVEDKRQELTERDVENKKLLERNQVLTDKVAALDRYSQDLDKTLVGTKATLASTETERDQARGEVRMTKVVLAATNAKLGKTETDLGNTTKELVDSQRAHGQTKVALVAAEKEHETTKATLKTTESTLETTKSNLEATKSSLEATKTTLKATKTALETTESTLEKTKSNLETSTSTLETTKSELSAKKVELQKAQAANKLLTEQNEELRKRVGTQPKAEMLKAEPE